MLENVSTKQLLDELMTRLNNGLKGSVRVRIHISFYDLPKDKSKVLIENLQHEMGFKSTNFFESDETSWYKTEEHNIEIVSFNEEKEVAK